MKKQAASLPVQSPVAKLSRFHFPIPRATIASAKFALVLGAAVILAACAGGPPTPPPPEDPAQAKADAKAREDFARDLPKPPER
jgi:hypothetical protein